MTRIVYVNGRYVEEDRATISIFDRGLLFGDSVYEVTSVLDGKLIDNGSHMRRLDRSLTELSMPAPAGHGEIERIQRELIKRNALNEGIVYVQVTRGPADRSFNFPEQPVPSLILFTQQKRIRENPQAQTGLSVVTRPDIRWLRRDIKTTNLLAASWAKQQARDAGADDVWFVEGGRITEGSSNNAYIVTAGRTVVTRDLGNAMLAGVTRKAVLALAARAGLSIDERPFSPEEAYGAAEAFVTSASSFVLPVVRIDGRIVGAGRPGPVTRQLRDLYVEFALSHAT